MDDRWGHLVGVTSLDIVTPLPAIDLDRVRAAARDLADRHAAAGLGWRPASAWAWWPPFAALLRDRGVARVAVNGIGEAARVAASGFAPVLEVPPIVGRQPQRFAELRRDVSAAAVCDHFVQAERIAAACRAAGVEGDLLLRVDVGRQRLGVRPGPDLSDLAQGIANLQGVRLVGLWAGGPPTATGVGRLGGQELGNLLTRCRASLDRSGYEISVVSVESLEAVETPSSVTETRTAIPGGSEVAIVSGVVSRPTRDQAVLDAGRALIGSSATVAGLPGTAHVSHIGPGFTVLSLPPERQDLAIGDVVALLPERPVHLPDNGPLLVYDRSGWSIEWADTV